MESSTEVVSQEESTAEDVISQDQQVSQHQLINQNNTLRRSDSLDIESANLRHHSHGTGLGWAVVLQLAFQSLGVVYGDIGTSPLYVYASTFTDGIKHKDDILGVLSLIFYTLTLIPLVKYVFIVLRANDNGDGGTFALYSLICRYAKVGLIPSQEIEDQNVSTFQLELPNNRTERASKIKSKLENSNFAKFFLLFATMLGTSMVIGDGVLTPCISVLSAVGGIKQVKSSITQDEIVWISVGIIIFLFTVQRFGTDKVGYSFAPIICVWFSFNAVIGAYNFIKYDPSVIKAINPKYVVDYFIRNKEQAWISLGGVVLSITGTEALFADVGHFSVRSIQLSMCCVTYPALLLAYTGQASFLRENMQSVSDTFYESIPGPLYWPMFVVAVLASIIASQAMISGTFSIIQQSLSLGCFPRVKIVHTSKKYPGQVYIPEISYLLMLACVFVTLGFRSTTKIGNAYGIAVVFVMALTSAFLVLIMTVIWKTHILLVIAYVVIIGSVELAYLSSVLYKFDQGGYLPLAFASFLMTVMFVWNYVYRKRYYYELDHKISHEKLREIVEGTSSHERLPGLAFFYSELVHGIPPIFKHYVENVPALHSVLVFVSFKSLPISKVPIEERFLFRGVQANKGIQVFRCVVRYGYKDVRNHEEGPFERLLFERLKEFVMEDHLVGLSSENEEIEGLDKAWRCGVVHLVGEHEVVAAEGANIAKRVLVDYAYNFLKRNLRQSNRVFDIPQKRMLKVGMTYEL
ncbi:potassium transporter 5 [Phtheirospermum japonicum]|uniref:Potassium transporter n=1 Tax=Phtheirospermum japonicum TaxID=374723 RepID=A0A830D508_9LAMI|nr:potassium transporter 5 [Phtheirospermum japonicum]